MCRVEIRCWTTKKIVQFALHETQKEITLDEQRKQEKNYLINLEYKQHNQYTSSTSNDFFYEFCRFNSSFRFLNCLRSLDKAKADLSFFEILILLRSNLAIGSCKTHLNEFIQMCGTAAIISGLKLVERIIKYIRIQAQTGCLEMHLQGPEDLILQSRCFDEIRLIAGSIASVTTRLFNCDSEDLLRCGLVISKLIDEIEQIFNDRSTASYRPPEKRIRTRAILVRRNRTQREPELV